MGFLRNAWYVAAWSDEIKSQLLGRTILNEPVLLYRDEVGRAVAIGDRCPHRFAPLHLGSLKGGAVECPYHGLQFDSSGVCVHSPHGDGKIPRNARVKAYPVVERYGIIWVWPGQVERADDSMIPRFDMLVDPALKTVKGSLNVKAHYEIVADNLLDLSHIQFIHANYQKMDKLLEAPHEVIESDRSVVSKRVVPNAKGPVSLMRNFPDPDTLIDYWLRVRWDAPSLCHLDIGASLPGRGEAEGIWRRGFHLLTPETETSTHYFYASTRNYRVNDVEEDRAIGEWQQVGFHQQDKPMLEAVQQMMGTTDLMSLRPIVLSSDKAAIRARHILAGLIQLEEAAAVGNAA
jgi:vanillate O-demethylase monooxygenase subunit